MSPKKYWENGALLNGVFCRRAGCSDEMLVTALTVRAATSVKSGPEVRMRPASVVAGGAAGAAAPPGVGSFAGAAVARSAVHIRPVRTRPITKPALTSSRMSNRRRMSLADVDAPRTGAGRFGNGHREDTVAQIGGDAMPVNRGGGAEGGGRRCRGRAQRDGNARTARRPWAASPAGSVGRRETESRCRAAA